MRWDADRPASPATDYPPPPLWPAVRLGLRNRCPFCGVGRVFAGYLRVVPECAHCGAQLGRLRADDAPPYFTIFITGHLLVPGVFLVEERYQPAMWIHMVIWLPLFTLICMAMLRPVKGAVVGWMSALGFLEPETAPIVARRPPDA